MAQNRTQTFIDRKQTRVKLACIALNSHSKTLQEILVSPPAVAGLLRRACQVVLELELRAEQTISARPYTKTSPLKSCQHKAKPMSS